MSATEMGKGLGRRLTLLVFYVLLVSLAVCLQLGGRFLTVYASDVSTDEEATLWRNLVVNGSFENGRDYWNPSRAGVRLDFPQDNEAPDGERVFRIEKRDQSAFSLRQTLLGPVQGNQPYTLSAWVKTESFVPAGARLIVITERWTWEGRISLPEGTNDWHRVQVPLALPPSSLYQVGIFLPAGSSGVVWLDGMQLEPGSAPGSYVERIHMAIELARRLDDLAVQLAGQKEALERMPASEGRDSLAAVLDERAQAVESWRARVREVLSASSTGEAHALWRALNDQDVSGEVHRLARVMDGSSLVVEPVSPWENTWPLAPSTGRAEETALTLQAYAGERLYASIALTNLKERSEHVRITWEGVSSHALAPEEREDWQRYREALGSDLVADPSQSASSVRFDEIVKVHEVIPVPRQSGERDLVGDALPLLNDARVLTLPPAESRELFLSFDTQGLAPGVYQATLRLTPASGGLGKTILVTLEILPLRLNRFDDRLQSSFDEETLSGRSPSGMSTGRSSGTPRLSSWGLVYANPQAAGAPEAYLADAIDHGINVFALTPTLILPVLSPDGTIKELVNFEEMDRRVQATKAVLEASGRGKAFYVAYYSAAHYFRQHAARFGVSYPSEAFDRAFKAWMRAWIDHLLELGLGYDDFAVQLRDEPDQPDEFELFIHTAKLLREVDPRVNILVTLNFRNPVLLEQAQEYVDIWVTLGDVLVDPNVARFLKDSQKEVWLYHASRRGKSLSPQGYYRVQGWMAYQHGLDGWGFFTWLSTNEETWAAHPEGNNFSAVYVTPAGPVASRRGEAWRRGLDDHLVLKLFDRVAERIADHLETSGADARNVDEARKRVTAAVANVLRAVDYPRTYEVTSGRADLFDETVATVREETLRLLREAVP